MSVTYQGEKQKKEEWGAQTFDLITNHEHSTALMFLKRKITQIKNSYRIAKFDNVEELEERHSTRMEALRGGVIRKALKAVYKCPDKLTAKLMETEKEKFLEAKARMEG